MQLLHSAVYPPRQSPYDLENLEEDVSEIDGKSPSCKVQRTQQHVQGLHVQSHIIQTTGSQDPNNCIEVSSIDEVTDPLPGKYEVPCEVIEIC